MSDVEKPALRGEAAWLAAREQVAQRNAATRKAGKAEREATERQREDARRAADVRRAGELARSSRRA
jgi:hypothetical protein